VHLPVLSSFCTGKSRRWQTNVQHLGITPWAPPHAYASRRWGNLAGVQHNPRTQSYVNDDIRADGLQKVWGFQVGAWNVNSLTGRAGEVVEALSDKKVDVACIQETRWKGTGCKFCGAKSKRYKLFCPLAYFVGYRPNFTKILCLLTVAIAQSFSNSCLIHYVLCTSSFIDNSMFSLECVFLSNERIA